MISAGGPKQQRRCCICDVDPSSLPENATQFWSYGFWEKKPNQKGIASCGLDDQNGCGFELRCFPVDHSIPGACAWGINTASGWIVYSGDLRLHGKRGHFTAKFVDEASKLHPKALILEGTNIAQIGNVSEREVYENGLKTISAAKGLVIADFPARDMDRLLTFLQIARDTGRMLAITPKDAYLLKTMRLLDETVPDVAADRNIVICQDPTSKKSPDIWQRNICKECDSRIVVADDIRSAQDQIILCFSFFDLNELSSIAPGPGSLYVYSSSEPHDEEQQIDFRRLHNWLDYFGIKSFGLPAEDGDGEWSTPESERGLHASGHACGPDLLRVVREIQPDMLIPVHSQHAQIYADQLKGEAVRVVLPSAGETVSF